MNKQELIDILENLECSTESLSYDNGYEQGVYDSLSHVILLDEPKKVVVPKFVAEWIDDLRGQISGVKLNSGALFMVFIGRQLERYYDEDYSFLTEKVEGWLTDPENKVKLMSAIDNGYEVEKEQLYYVSFGFDRFLIKGDCKTTTGEDFIWIEEWECIENEGFEDLVKFTEQEIKSIDERYWPFAVKVGNE